MIVRAHGYLDDRGLGKYSKRTADVMGRSDTTSLAEALLYSTLIRNGLALSPAFRITVLVFFAADIGDNTEDSL
jgi:hypothetical protein